MKKIGIITLHGYSNYGNKLQNYATQEVMKSLGTNPITIINNVSIKQDRKTKYINKLKNLNLKTIVNFIYRRVKKLRRQIYLTSKEKRTKSLTNDRIVNFKKFTKNNINETDYIISEIDIPRNFHEKFDYLIVGSDQVWNPHYINNSSIYFLSFAPKRKRIAYSASFGISVLPAQCNKSYGDRLSQFEHISVREEAGADIVRSLTGRDVKVLIDPTLMLDKKDWLKIARKSKYKPSKPYLLTYFLGQVSEKIKNLINKLSTEYNLEIVILEDISSDIKNELRYTTDPGEFIDYINSADLILTDSFHGTVFSILFERPFIAFNRDDGKKSINMSSRLETLLSKFELEGREWKNVKNSGNYLDVNFSQVPQTLEFERNKALDYLKNALEIE